MPNPKIPIGGSGQVPVGFFEHYYKEPGYFEVHAGASGGYCDPPGACNATTRNGWGVSGGSGSPPSYVVVSVPEDAAPATGGFVMYGFPGTGPTPPDDRCDLYTGTFDVVCICTPTASPSAPTADRTPSNYKLVVELSGGKCSGTLSGITWSPAPDSGQGTMQAAYNGRSYNTAYNGSVTATDANGCLASADFRFSLGFGPYPPGCINPSGCM